MSYAPLALGAFAFGDQYKSATAIGLRIASDLSFEFFDIAENIQRLKQAKSPLKAERSTTGGAYPIGLNGRIDRFNREKGFGFIGSADGEGENFYLHVSKTDVYLERQLNEAPGVPGGSGWFTFTTPLSIVFDHGGFRPGEVKPQAINAQLAGSFETKTSG